MKTLSAQAHGHLFSRKMTRIEVAGKRNHGIAEVK